MNILSFFRKPRLIQDQIKVFVADRIRHGDIAPSYTYWLQQFSMWYPIMDVHDITDEDENRFLQDVSVLYPTHYQLKCAKTAIENLRRYYSARDKRIENNTFVGYKDNQMKKFGRPPLEADNRKLVALRDADRRKWTFKALGEEFGIHPTTAEERYHKWKPVFDKELSTTK